MRTPIRSILLILLTVLAQNVLASQFVQLEDGRRVQLNDDFTWQYVEFADSKTSETAAVIAAPVVTAKKRTTVIIGSNKPSLKLSDSGVDIILGAAQYLNGKVIIPTAITNQSSQSVISIGLNVQLLDENGQLLAQHNSTIWQSIKRIADTYLRAKTSAQGKAIEIEVSKADSYQLLVNVESLETR